MEAEYATIIYVPGAVAWITLNRPEKWNAQSDELYTETSLALETAGLDPDVDVVVITGAGDQAFSAGADIDQFPTRQPARRDRQRRAARRTRPSGCCRSRSWPW